jgi:uncharacterized cupredoxin-like copper-binding protein
MTLTKKILPLAALLAVALPGGSAMAAPKAKFRFDKPTYVISEGASVTVTVTRDARHGHSRKDQTASVSWSITGGSATNGADYDTSIAEGQLTFAPGEATKTITVNTHEDFDIEGLETIGLKLSGASRNALITSPRTAQVLIADNDGPTQIQLAPASQSVNEAAGTAQFFAVRSGAITGDSGIDYATSDGSATAGSDYTAASGHFDYHIGDFSKTINVPVTEDTAVENSETFNVTLSNVSGATLGNASSTVTIVDNDSAPVFVLDASSYEVNENGSVDVTVLRQGNISAAAVNSNDVFQVTWATSDGSATNPADYVPSADNQLEFDASDDAETITIAASDTQISLVDDALVEGDETFGLALQSASNSNGSGAAPSIGTPASATVTVHDNDVAQATGGTGSDTGAGTGGNVDQPGQVVLGARQVACGLTVKVSKKQKLLKQKVLKLQLRSKAACKVSLSTVIKQLVSKKKTVRSAKALRFKGKNTSLTLQPGKAKTVKVKFTKKTLKAIKKALQARKNLVATVVVTSKDSASKSTRKTLKITIRR